MIASVSSTSGSRIASRHAQRFGIRLARRGREKHSRRASAPIARQRHRRPGRDLPCASLPSTLPMNDLRDTPSTSGRSATRNCIKVSEQREIVRDGFAKADSGVESEAHRDRCRTARHASKVCRKNSRISRANIVVVAARAASSAGSPCMCMAIAAGAGRAHHFAHRRIAQPGRHR